MMKRHVYKALWVGVLAFGLAACAAMKKNGKPMVENIYSVTWQLQSVCMDSGLVATENDQITLEFTSGGHLGGHGGCNTFGGSFKTDGKHIKTERVMSTKRGCPTLNVEAAMLKALREADNYAIEGKTLLLKKGDAVLLIYKAGAEKPE